MSRYESISYDEIERALSYIPAYDRETWYLMAMSVKSELGETGFEIWDSWSRTGDTYNQQHARAVWRGIDAAGGRGIGSLIYHAKLHGWQPNAKAKQLTPDEIDARRAKREADFAAETAQREQMQERAALRAAQIWADAKQLDAADHCYHWNKKIFQCGNVRVGVYPMKSENGTGYTHIKNTLLIPVKDGSKLHSLQAIFEDGQKHFLPGGKKSGCYFTLGKPDDNPVLICEGYATACSLHRATGWLTLAAFDSGNLQPVAVKTRAKLPNAKIIICADNDRWKKPDKNPGVKAAMEAAAACGGYVAVPVFKTSDTKPTDFNDLHALETIGAIKPQLLAAKLPAEMQLKDYFGGEL